MEFFFEIILNFVGLLVGLVIGTISYIGFKNTGSPTLFRLSIAFFAIGIGFGILAIGFTLDDFIFKTGNINLGISTLGVASQTIGYWFIAFYCRGIPNEQASTLLTALGVGMTVKIGRAHV